MDLAWVFLYLKEGPTVILYPAICTCFLLLFSQPKRVDRSENRAPHPLRLHRFCLAMADKATVIPPSDPWPFSTVTVEDLQALVTEGLLRPLSIENFAIMKHRGCGFDEMVAKEMDSTI
jgi:hypothetical protein